MLTSDYTETLTHLMKFPNDPDVSIIIRHALHMKSPNIYERPPGVFVQLAKDLNINKSEPKKRLSTPQSQLRNQSRTLPRPKSASSSRRSSQVNSLSRINGMQTKAALASLSIAAQSHNLDVDSAVVDGYLENDPEVLKLELQHTYNLMSVTRLNLMKYVSILRRNIPENAVDELHQAMDGIEELCSLLKPKTPYVFKIPTPETEFDIEPAMEANETSPQKVSSNNLRATSVTNSPARSKNSTSDPFIVIPRSKLGVLKDVEMRTFQIKSTIDADDNKLPNIDPVMERRNSE